jgi:hypothetical protein
MDKPVVRRPEREGYARRTEGFTAKPMKWRGGLGAPVQVLPPVGSGSLSKAADELKKRKRRVDDAVDRMSG